MAFSKWRKVITDASGNVDTGASAQIFRESDGAAAVVYSDPAGSSLSQPVNANSDGEIVFYAAAVPEGYKVTITFTDASTKSLRHEPVGEAQRRDVGTSADDLITVSAADVRYSLTVQDNTTATTDPTVNDDTADGYSVGSRWYNTSTDEAFLCLDASDGAAVWAKTTLNLDELGSLATKDEGTGAAQFQDNTDNRAEYLAKALSWTEVAGTAYTLQASDNGKGIWLTSSSAVTVTLPDSLAGGTFQCFLVQAGIGSVTVVGETAVIESADDIVTLDKQMSAMSINGRDASTWFVAGGMVPIISETGLSLYDHIQWSGSQFVKATDSARVGTLIVADDATSTTAFAYTTGTVDLPNDGAGADTDATYAPQGVTSLYDTGTEKLDFSDIGLGDQVTLRVDIEVTTSAAAQEVDLLLSLAEGGSSPRKFTITRQAFPATGTYDMTGQITFDIRNADIQSNPGAVQIYSDGSADVVVNDYAFFVTVRG